MIEGLYFDIEYDELKKHLEDKVFHHNSRTTWYQQRITDLKAGGVESDAQVSGGSPISNLENQAKSHKQRADLFAFMADHLIEGETYRLSENELIKVELISRYF
jgi:hypothetical protein